MASLFTAARLQIDTPSPKVGISLDQRFAAAVAGQTPSRSMQLGVNMHPDCDANFPCIYIGCISYADATTPLPPQTDVRAAFDSSIAGLTTADAIAHQAALRKTRRSILDHVLGQAQSLTPKLGQDDAQKLDQYLTSVRSLEQQLSVDPKAACPATQPGVIGRDAYQQAYPAMMDLMVLALQCDVTRAISFTFGPGHCNHMYSFLPGINDVHHGSSHHNGDPAKLAQLTTINTWEMSIFARFIGGLAAVKEEQGTLLDRTIAAMSSELGDGSLHNFDNLAVVVAGGGGNVITGNRHLRAGGQNKPADLAELWVAMLRGLGVPTPTFGGFGQSHSMDGLRA